jgi:hypothetical protein
MVNLPGFTSNVKVPSGTRQRGSFSHARPIGKTSSWATTYPMVSEGYGAMHQYRVSYLQSVPRIAYVAESKELIETSKERDEHAQNNPCSDR